LDSSAVVLGERPTSMALVPTGEIVPTQGNPEYAQSMRSAVSPDQHVVAVVDRTPQGAGGISILDAASKAEVLYIQTGRGAPQLAWSPDSTRLAYTSGNDSPTGLLWRLRMMVMTDRQPTLLGSTQDLSLHSVLWAPPLSGCP
jgi:dipeptidyl aminopeptidase/acylaminoacyl peptidase